MDKWRFDRRCLLVLLLLQGCYQAHERPLDGGTEPDASMWPCTLGLVQGATICYMDAITIDGAPAIACLCTFGGICSRNTLGHPGCPGVRVVGDSADLSCAHYVPPTPQVGFCLRACETDADCTHAMRCLDVMATFGPRVDIPRACFEIVPVALDDGGSGP